MPRAGKPRGEKPAPFSRAAERPICAKLHRRSPGRQEFPPARALLSPPLRPRIALRARRIKPYLSGISLDALAQRKLNASLLRNPMPAIQSALVGQKKSKEALDEAQARIQQILKG